MNVTEKIADAISREDTGFPLERRSQLDRAFLLAASEAVVAAIRAMTPTEQAELIGGDVQDPFGKSSDWDTYARVIGPWREVTR